MGQKKVSLLVKCPHFRRLKCMQEWYVLGVGKVFREVSSVQE